MGGLIRATCRVKFLFRDDKKFVVSNDVRSLAITVVCKVPVSVVLDVVWSYSCTDV
jgi:hypothetical protein